MSFYCFVLKDYLETKRLVFARFYFLSNEDLLDILANSSKNPDAVQVCMIFDPLKYKPFLLLIFLQGINVGGLQTYMHFVLSMVKLITNRFAKIQSK